VAFSRGLLIYKIKNRSNKFGPAFSPASFLPRVTTKVECQFYFILFGGNNYGRSFSTTLMLPHVMFKIDLDFSTCHIF